MFNMCTFISYPANKITLLERLHNVVRLLQSCSDATLQQRIFRLHKTCYNINSNDRKKLADNVNVKLKGTLES